VQKLCNRCIAYRQAKSKVLSYSLYTSLLVPKEPWVNIFMDSILGFPR